MILLGLGFISIGIICIALGLTIYGLILLFKRVNIWVAAAINAITCKYAYEKGKKEGRGARKVKVIKVTKYKCPCETIE